MERNVYITKDYNGERIVLINDIRFKENETTTNYISMIFRKSKKKQATL